MKDLPLERITTLAPAFAVNTLMMMKLTRNVCVNPLVSRAGVTAGVLSSSLGVTREIIVVGNVRISPI